MNWIKCSERLPEEGGRVLVWAEFEGAQDPTHHVYTAELLGAGWKVDAQDDWADLGEFSHWMPLPEGPKEDE